MRSACEISWMVRRVVRLGVKCHAIHQKSESFLRAWLARTCETCTACRWSMHPNAVFITQAVTSVRKLQTPSASLSSAHFTKRLDGWMHGIDTRPLVYPLDTPGAR